MAPAGGSRQRQPSRRRRLLHLCRDGPAPPPGHPFRATHSPPNGWGCSCYVTGARTAAGVRRVGGDPDKPLPANWSRVDPRTGVPVGIDRGWGYAAGASVTDDIRAMIAANLGNYEDPVGAFEELVQQASPDELYMVPMLREGIWHAVLRAEAEATPDGIDAG